MQFIELDRSELPPILASFDFSERVRKRGFGFELPEKKPEPRMVWVCWSDENDARPIDRMPRLIVVRDEELDDFHAWAATFLDHLRPLTSFVRVLSWEAYSIVRYQPSTPAALPTGALVGAILGETLMNATGRGFLNTLPVSAFESTFFAAVSKTFACGANPRLLQLADQGWHDVRALTDQPTRRVSREAFAQTSAVLCRLINDRIPDGVVFAKDEHTMELADACRELQMTGRIPDITWRRMSRGNVPIEIMKASKERRVEAFEAAVRWLSADFEFEPVASFLTGYLASLVSGGSLEHAHLVFPLQDKLPSAMLWYGICAGLAPANRVESENGHLGLKIRRWLLSRETLLDLPTCDLSSSELAVLLRGLRGQSFRQTHSSALRVEIAPMITSLIRWPGKQPSGQLSFLEDEAKRPRENIEALRELVGSIRESLAIAENLASQRAHAERGKRRASK